MMRIRKAQMAALAERSFLDESVQHFRLMYEEFVDELSDAELRARIQHGFARARAWGLTWEYSLTLFVAHMITINPRFDDQPAIRRVLQDTSLPANERMDAMFDRVTDEDWDEAARMVDPEAYWRAAVGTVAGEDEEREHG
jgi:hypothetical protein